MYLIYKHTLISNDENSGKSYIGLTSKTIAQRSGINGKKYLIKKDGIYLQKKFASAIIKYGWNNFSHEILECGINNRIQANLREQYWIRFFDTFNTGFNMTLGGYDQKYTTNSEISKEKIKNNLSYKRIYQYDLNGNFLNEWKSVREASAFYNIFPSNIYFCVDTFSKTSVHSLWSYKKYNKIVPKIPLTGVYQYTLSGKFIKKMENY